MRTITLLIMIFTLTACGNKNVAAPLGGTHLVQQAELSHSTTKLKARMTVTSILGGSVRVEDVELGAMNLDEAAQWRGHNIVENANNNDKEKSFALYIHDIEKRLNLVTELSHGQFAKAEIILDFEGEKEISGEWGWLDNNGARTTFEPLPPMNGKSRIILKTENSQLIADLLQHKRLLSIWLNSKAAQLNHDATSWAAIQNLKFSKKIEIEKSTDQLPAGFIKLKAVYRTYSVSIEDHSVRVKIPGEPRERGGRMPDTIGRCVLKVAKVSQKNERDVPLKDVVEFDQNEKLSQGWWLSRGDSMLRMKTGLETNVVNVGLVSWGNCSSNENFMDSVPSTYQSNIAPRMIVEAQVYLTP